MYKLLLLCCTVVLAACAGNPFAPAVQPGDSREVVLARMGTPTRVVPLENGERLQYSGQPAGQYAWMVDLDRAGQVLRRRQVLTAAEFQRIEPGKWTRSDVEREFGPPASIDGVARWDGPILTYRWSDGGNMLYWVYLDRQGVVQRAHPGMEFPRLWDRD